MTVDGQTHWVVDKYNGVFVYNADGVLQGQWDAGWLNRPEGIATDETDIWVVDRATDKVYFYNDAAARRSGSQSPDSYFHLADGNTNPRGITTDGETIWVVDDGQYCDRVFVYDTSGNLQGSWKLSHNVKPRGITINPGRRSRHLDRRCLLRQGARIPRRCVLYLRHSFMPTPNGI